MSTKTKRSPKNAPGVDMGSALRVSFLEQAAILLASKSSSKNDIMKVLSITMVKELRELSYVEQIRPSIQIKRSICKQCLAYLVPDKNGKAAIELRSKRRRLIRRCLNCGHEASYVWNPNYMSRNEKALANKKESNPE